MGRLERRAQRRGALDPAHPASAATGDGLDEQREADTFRRGRRASAGRARRGAAAAWAARPPGPPRWRGALLPVSSRTGGRRADEGDLRCPRTPGPGRGSRTGSRSRGRSRQHRPRRRPDDPLQVEVGPHRVPDLADLVSLVRLEPVLGLAVLIREDGDCPGAELGGGAEGANGDLATVGDEDLRNTGTSRVGVGTSPGGSGRCEQPSEVPQGETKCPRCGRPAPARDDPCAATSGGGPARPQRDCRVVPCALRRVPA